MEDELNRVKEEKEDLEKQIIRSEKALFNQENQMSTFQTKQHEELEMRIEKVPILEKQLTKQEELLKEKQKQFEVLIDEKKRLEKNNESFEQLRISLSHNEQRITEEKKKKEELIAKNKQLLEQYETCKKEWQMQIAHLQENNHYLEEENRVWLEESKKSKKNIEEKVEDLYKLTEEKEQLKTTLDDTTSEIKVLRQQLTNSKEIEERLKKELNEQRADVESHSQELIQIDTLVEEKKALTSALYDAHEEIAKMGEKLDGLEKASVEAQELRDKLANAEQELIQINEKQEDEKESIELNQAKRQVNELMEQNEELRKEVVQSQQEIGEVLISAKKQANRTLEEATLEARHMISSAELELENISNRAKKIYIQAAESKEGVVSMYDELLFKIEQLSKGSLLKEMQKENG